MASVNEEPGNRKEHGRWQTHGDGMRPIDRVLAKLDGWTRSGNEYSALCPAHNDKKPSLTVTEAADGTVLLKCHTGCAFAAIVAALGLRESDLFPDQAKTKPPRIVDTYDYVDEEGTLLYQVVRFDPKDFRQRRPHGTGWTWNVKETRRVLYHLPELLDAETVYIAEGEKDVDRLRAWGLVATCNAGGAGKWRDEYSQSIAGKHVIILPDNDAPGEAHAVQVARSVLPVAASVKLVRLPDLPTKGDVSDWRSAGHTEEELLALVDATQEWTEEDVAADATGHTLAEETSWPEPGKIPDGLLPVPKMEPVMLPEALRPWLTDIATRIQCPLDFPAVGALTALSSAVGRQISIRPKERDDWTVIPNTWGAIVAPPGFLKTPALAETMKPLQRLEIAAWKHYEEELKAFALKTSLKEAQKDDLKRRLKEALKNKEETEPILQEAKNQEDAAVPVPRRFIINDATVEKLGEILNQNPHGVLQFRDELTGWLRSLEKEGHEPDRAFFLEAWNGTGAYTYDRIGRGTLRIASACVSLLGGIQPGPLSQYLRSAVHGGTDDDGLIQRLQLVVYPDAPKGWKHVDQWPNTDAKNTAFALFQKLADLTPSEFCADTTDPDDVPFLHFDPDAQAFFNRWWEALELQLQSADEHPVIVGHLAKYRSLMPSLALLFHLTDVATGGHPGPVSSDAAELAAAWCAYLEAHARRIYQTVTSAALLAARFLADRILAGKLPNPFTPHDVYHNGWTALSSADAVTDAADILEDLGWLRSERIPAGEKGGRPRFHYHINPRLQRKEPPR